MFIRFTPSFTGKRLITLLLSFVTALGIFLVPGRFSPTVHAYLSGSTITVNALSDDQTPSTGACVQSGTICLRNAIATATLNSSATTINFSVDGSVVLDPANGTLSLANSAANPITIDGTGHTITIDGGSAIQIFSISSNGDLILNELTLSGGLSGGTIPVGGAIDDSGTLVVTNCTIIDSATQGNAANHYATGYGGAIYVESGAVATISNSTFYGNQSDYGGAISSFGTLILGNSTLTNNHASYGGGLDVQSTATYLFSSIVAGNLDNNAAPDINDSVGTPLISRGYNLIGDSSTVSGTLQSTDQSGVNAALGTLAGNGGPTQTVAIGANSAAIGKGDCAGDSGITPAAPAVSTDQRGNARKNTGSGLGCDVGAYETAPLPTATPTDTATNTATFTPTDTATNTPTNTPTDTATNTETFTPTNTATDTPSNTATFTPTNTATSTPSDTATNTATFTPTDTTTNTATNTSSNTATFTPTNTATSTPSNTPTSTPSKTSTSTNTAPSIPTNTATASSTPSNTATSTLSKTSTSTNTSTNTATLTRTSTNTVTNTPVNTVTSTATATNTATNTPSKTSTPSSTATATLTRTPTATATSTPAPRVDSIGIYRSGTFYLRLHNTQGFADTTVAFNPPGHNLPVVGDWTGAGFDAVGVFDQNTASFTLCTVNNTASCALVTNHISFSLGNGGDTPLAGRWQLAATHAGAGVYRPGSGVLYLKNALTTGFADNAMVMGLPGDEGVTGDWTGKGFDSPGIYRPSAIAFYLSNQVTNGPVFADITLTYGSSTDLPITGDWIAQGHDGVGMFRPTNGFVYLKNMLTSGFADNTFFYGQAGDQPVAGHWQVIYPPAPPPQNVLIAKTAAPVPNNGGIVPGDHQIGG